MGSQWNKSQIAKYYFCVSKKVFVLGYHTLYSVSRDYMVSAIQKKITKFFQKFNFSHFLVKMQQSFPVFEETQKDFEAQPLLIKTLYLASKDITPKSIQHKKYNHSKYKIKLHEQNY